MKHFFMLLLCFLMQWLQAQTSYGGVCFAVGCTYYLGFFDSFSNPTAAVSSVRYGDYAGVVEEA